MIKKIICLIVLYICISCSNNTNSNIDKNKKVLSEPETLYKLAKTNFDGQNFELARQQFKEINKLFPLSNEAIQSQIMIAFIDYIKMDYENAILNYRKIISKYPSHKDLDYIYYMIAMCNYEQLQNEALDGYYNELALNSFNQVITRFPESKYAKDSRQKIILVKSNIAAKHMEIGRFYLESKKYIAALNRFKIVVDKFSMTKFTPEALHRMVEAYYEMGMYEDSYNTAALLGYNYPESKWYKYSYNLVEKTDGKETFLKKIRNLFDG
ncbi:outer membrane protein assembly factor BamD [Pelagibacteraceae bacterium]|nr:outer membrane protein assembly factor BamD [Pelagibacteraceae bacterium]